MNRANLRSSSPFLRKTSATSCCTRLFQLTKYLLFPLSLTYLFSEEMSEMQKEGEEFGKAQSAEILSQLEKTPTLEFFPDIPVFDSEKALYLVESKSIPQTEEKKFIEQQKTASKDPQFHLEEYFFQNSDKSTKNPLEPLEAKKVLGEEESIYSIETCVESGNPFILTLNRSLNVKVLHTPGKEKRIKSCLGHATSDSFFWKKDAEKKQKQRGNEWKQNPDISSYSVIIGDGGSLQYYCVYGKYWHKDDCLSCNLYQYKLEKSEDKWEELGEEWVYDDPQALQFVRGPKCNFLSQECTDQTPEKVINGLSVKRKCWKQTLSFYCQPEKKRRLSGS